VLITIENFGAIKYFQFDTEKDMYLLFGKNSVGKSYAISLVYLILKNILSSSKERKEYYSYSYEFKRKMEIDINRLEKKLEASNEKEIDISSYVEKKLISELEFFVKKLNDSLLNTFDELSNLQNEFTRKKIQITIITVASKKILELRKKNYKLEFRIVRYEIYKKSILKKDIAPNEYNFEVTNNKIIFFFENDEFFKYKFFGAINGFVLDFFKELENTNSIYYLPASRSGLYQALGAFGQIFAELSKNRNFISKPITIPAISEPIADYYLYLSNITPSKKSNSDFIDYVNEIEKDILQGIVTFDNERKKLFFTPNNTSLKLDLSATSSMVSEISPITSYIKYIFTINRNQQGEQKPLIFIEEPEAHLHPETQVKLMEVFARMVKDNKIKLVMTSHSNYLFNKASNLVMDNKIDKDKFKAVLFDMTGEGSIARELETDEYGIEDENFIDTAESIYEEKIQLINKLNG
jgi:predicted ATPase